MKPINKMRVTMNIKVFIFFTLIYTYLLSYSNNSGCLKLVIQRLTNFVLQNFVNIMDRPR